LKCEISKENSQETGTNQVFYDGLGTRVLLISDYYLEDNFFGVFVAEKGYIYYPELVKLNVPLENSLDKFSGASIVNKKLVHDEVWKYKKIDQDWYLYYRQYHLDGWH
jgi:hypothetical protein